MQALICAFTVYFVSLWVQDINMSSTFWGHFISWQS